LHAPVCADILSGCFVADPRRRMKLSELLDHAWMRGPVLSPDALRVELSRRAATVAEEKRKLAEEKERRRREAARAAQLARGGPALTMTAIHRSIKRSDQNVTPAAAAAVADKSPSVFSFDRMAEAVVELEPSPVSPAAADVAAGTENEAPFDAAAAVAALPRLEPSGAAGASGGGGVARYCAFFVDAAAVSPAELLGRLQQALSAMCAAYTPAGGAGAGAGGAGPAAGESKLKVTLDAPGGRVQFTVRLFAHVYTPAECEDGSGSGGGGGGVAAGLPALFVVQLQRRSGSALRFQDTFKQLCSYLEDVIAPPPANATVPAAVA
jgi:hypothetical protein